jgi:hypothetical protein
MVAVGLSCGGCLACEDCTIASDNFNRADNFGDINDGAPFTWGGTNSDMWISSNELLIVSAAAEQLTCPTAHPDSTGSGVVSMLFKADAGDEVEVWLNGSDSDNCLVARLTVGTSQPLEIISRVSGTDTVLESTTATTVAFDQHGLALYYDASTGTARAVTDNADLCAFLIDEVGYKAGVGIGSNAGLVYIDDFMFSRLGDGENGCPELEDCPYDSCAFYPIDSGWDGVLTLSGATDGSCSGCEELNDTFVIPLDTSNLNQSLFVLEYNSDTICTPSTGTQLRFIVNVWCNSSIGLGIPTPTQYGIRVFVQVNRFGFTTTWAWYKYLGTTPPDLFSTYTGFTLYFTNNSGGWCSTASPPTVDSVSFNPP